MTLAAVVPLIVLALLLLYVLVSSAAEVRRQEVALAKLRGFSTGKVVRFAVAEPVAVLLLTVPVGIVLAVVGQRVAGRHLAGPDTVRGDPPGRRLGGRRHGDRPAGRLRGGARGGPRAPGRLAVVRHAPAAARRRWSLLAQGALVMLSVAAVVQIVTSDATQSSSFVELLAPLFVALGASVLALVLIGMLARLWMRRTVGAGWPRHRSSPPGDWSDART